jgi:hypothetical protein
MSQNSATTTPATQAAAPLSGDAAYGVLFKNAYVLAWREKLARVYNIQARTPEEEVQFLQATQQLRHRYEGEQQKQAAAADPAFALLQQSLGLAPTGGAATQGGQDAETANIRKFAAQLSFEPTIAHAALSMLMEQQQQTPATPVA